MAVRAVIFDFGGVLCFHPPEERFEPIARVFHIPTAQMIRLFWATRVDYDAGRVDPRAYWSRIAGLAGVAFDERQLPRLVRLEVELWNAFDERMLGWAAHLQAHGFGTAILSNLPLPLGEELRRTPGFLHPFDHVTFSYELGAVKPQPEIYRDAIGKLNIAPEDTLFLDDRLDNVEGARAVGLRAEVYSGWEDLEKTIARYELPTPMPDVARLQ